MGGGRPKNLKTKPTVNIQKLYLAQKNHLDKKKFNFRNFTVFIVEEPNVKKTLICVNHLNI